MDEQERYYKAKNEQLRRAEDARAEAHTKGQIDSLASLGIYAAAFLIFILFFLAPGLLIETVVLKTFHISVSNEYFWANSAVIDLGLIAVLFLVLGLRARAIYAFIGICVVSALLCFYVSPGGGTNVANLILEEHVKTLGSSTAANNQASEGEPEEIVTKSPEAPRSVDEVKPLHRYEQSRDEPKEEIIEPVARSVDKDSSASEASDATGQAEKSPASN